MLTLRGTRKEGVATQPSFEVRDVRVVPFGTVHGMKDLLDRNQDCVDLKLFLPFRTVGD